jgi:hypothetical protein
MEPRNCEKPSESGNDKENLALPTKERKRRFQIVKLEERVAPQASTGPYSANYACSQACTGGCLNHNETLVRDVTKPKVLRVKTNLKAGLSWVAGSPAA